MDYEIKKLIDYAKTTWGDDYLEIKKSEDELPCEFLGAYVECDYVGILEFQIKKWKYNLIKMILEQTEKEHGKD